MAHILLLFLRQSLSWFQSLHFPFWSVQEIFSTSSGFCSDASNDFIRTFVSITTKDAPIASPSDFKYQIPLHVKCVTAKSIKLFIADFGFSGAMLLELSYLRFVSIAFPTATFVYNVFKSRDAICLISLREREREREREGERERETLGTF